MEDRPSARQYYSSIRGEVELERFQELISEEINNELLYVHNKKRNIVTVYKNNTERAKPFWDITFLLSFVIMAFSTCNILHNSFIWDSISYDLSLVALLIAALLFYIRRRVSYRAVKLEKLREIKLDNKRARDHIVSIRAFKTASAVFIFFVLFFIGFWQSYSLAYLRYLSEGGPQAITIQGKINEDIEFDEKTTEIPYSLNGSGTFEEIELYLRIDKCPDEAAIYINGKEAGAPLEYYRNSGGLLKESYFTNIIRTTLGYKAEEINTLEIRAGSFDKVWTFVLKEDQGDKA